MKDAYNKNFFTIKIHMLLLFSRTFDTTEINSCSCKQIQMYELFGQLSFSIPYQLVIISSSGSVHITYSLKTVNFIDMK